MLGPITGLELARYFEHQTPGMTVVMISERRQIEATRWPNSVRDFVHKALGPYAILDAALEAHELVQIERRMGGSKRGRINRRQG
jgi:hypothetical protein